MPTSDLDVQIQGVPKLSGPLLGICSLGRVKRIFLGLIFFLLYVRICF